MMVIVCSFEHHMTDYNCVRTLIGTQWHLLKTLLPCVCVCSIYTDTYTCKWQMKESKWVAA